MSETETREADDGTVLRSIARSIRPTFPEAADLLLGIERMHWPTEAHRQHEAAHAARAEVARLREAVEATADNLANPLEAHDEDDYNAGRAAAKREIAADLRAII